MPTNSLIDRLSSAALLQQLAQDRELLGAIEVIPFAIPALTAQQPGVSDDYRE